MAGADLQSTSGRKEPIRICFIATGADLGGAPRSLLEMIQALLDTQTIEPYVILRSGGMLESALTSLGVPNKVLRFPLALKSQKVPDWLKLKILPCYERILGKVIAKGHFDIVHNNGVLYDVGIRAAHKVDVPCICHVREYAQTSNGIAFLDEERARKSMALCDYLIFISEGVADRFKNWSVGIKSTVLYNGFDIERYLHPHAPILTGAPYRLLLAGHVMPTKGQMEAVRATCELCGKGYDVRLTIVGLVKDESYHRALLEYIETRNASDVIKVCDFVDDLSEMRAVSDVCLICSTACEGLGRVTVEGMLAGCLAIGSDAGGTTEVIDDGTTGLLYDASDYLSLASKIEYAICHPKKMNEIARQGQEQALEAFDSKKYAERLCEVYRTVLKQREDEHFEQHRT